MGFLRIAGVDEAGRGPLAGPVYAAAVILDPQQAIIGLKDSKRLSSQKRFLLANIIKEKALSWSVAFASTEEIDTLNILQASLLAMKRAIQALSIEPEEVWIDGNQTPSGLPMKICSIVKGDALKAPISAASILAKTARDEVLIALHQAYPQYGFAQHKGYPTPEHLRAIEKHGIIALHRKSFSPISKWLLANHVR